MMNDEILRIIKDERKMLNVILKKERNLIGIV